MSGLRAVLRFERPAGVRFTLRERLWHWIQTLLLLSLPLTGFALHFPEASVPLLTFADAVTWHSRIGLLLWANALFGLVFYVAAGRWPKAIHAPGDFTGGAVRLLRHTVWGAIRGEPHPFEAEGGPPTPLSGKIAYVALLLILIPGQMVTGALMWLRNKSVIPAEGFLGLPVLGPTHTLGGYLFVAFLLLHIYISTLEPDARGRLRAMFTGKLKGRSVS